MTGKRVLCHSNLHSNYHSLDIDLLSEGLYIMKITTVKGVENKKLLVR